ncbi:hypothetical protein RhiJN_22609 [Ceratobasidium sp. AG-Ba]|nr:hypothetical protein RhiJN_22609 [Ceratobasidium sp. AG-Ba]
MSGLGSLSSSSDPRDGGRISFPHGRWNAGEFFNWYQNPDTLKRIARIQIRKEGSPVPHRFIIVCAISEDGKKGAFYRFDRRPNIGPAYVVAKATQSEHCGLAKDDYEVVKDPSTFSSAICEVELIFQKRVDLSSIVKACFAISQDPDARNYSLQQYNCFFFSWTLLMVVSRKSLPYRVPEYVVVKPLCLKRIPALTERIVNRAANVLQDIILKMTAKFHASSTKKLVSGLGPLEKIAWGLPTSSLQAILEGLFRTHFHINLKGKLSTHIKEAISQRGEKTWNAVLSSRLSSEKLDTKLWLDDMRNIISEAMSEELYSGLWDGILSAISGGHEEEELPPGDSDIKLPFPVVGKQAAQLSVIWKWVMPSMLLAAKNAASGQASGTSEDNAKMFDLAWSGGAKAALETAKSVVARTRSQFKDQDQHDRLWEAVWEMWDECERATKEIARKGALKVIDKVVQDIAGMAAQSFTLAMRSTELETVKAYVFKKNRLEPEPIELTSLTLDVHMQNVMRENVVGGQSLEDVKKKIGTIWEESRKHQNQV